MEKKTPCVHTEAKCKYFYKKMAGDTNPSGFLFHNRKQRWKMCPYTQRRCGKWPVNVFVANSTMIPSVTGVATGCEMSKREEASGPGKSVLTENHSDAQAMEAGNETAWVRRALLVMT